jgi:hypothetical protein
MNERFKFRAWDIINKKMYKCAGFLSGQVIIIEDDGKVLGKNDEGFILMQFTGLTDKNGEEIYDGDVLSGKRSDADIWVIYTEPKASYQFRILNHTHHRWHCPYSKELKVGFAYKHCVVGNIYENQELISEG